MLNKLCLNTAASSAKPNQYMDSVVMIVPALREKLFTKKGELQSYIEIYVNGVSTHPQGLTYPIKDGDEIAVTVLAAGG